MRRAPLLPALLLVLLALACRKEPAPAAAPARAEPAAPAPPPAPEPAPPRLRDYDFANPRDAELGLFVHGDAELGIFARGEGSLSVSIEREGAAAETTTVAATGSVRTPATLPLPGSGSRALRVRVTAPAGATLEKARVRDVEPLLPAANQLAGALRGRSLLVVVCDALHAAHLKCHGYARDTSPNIDALAREGVRFASARSQSSWTVPSIATCFTGLEQERHAVRYFGNVLDPSVPTLAEAFGAAGYETVAFVQNPLVSAEAGFARGFDGFEDYPGESRPLLLAALQKYLAAPRERPVFVYVHLLPPHAPYSPPGEFAARFAKPDPDVDASEVGIVRIARTTPGPDDPTVIHLEAMYDNNIAYGDHLVGEMVRALDARGREKSALLFLSDHGEAFAQHGVIGHLMNTYDEMVHIPMVMWAPGSALSAGSVVGDPVWMPDVLPSLVELFGLEVNGDLPGRSFAGLLEGGRGDATRVLRISALYEANTPRQRAIVYGRFKLVAPAGRQSTALFDLEADPRETKDVAADHPVIAAALRAEFARWIAEGLVSSTTPGFTPDPKLQAEMAAIGYAVGGK